MGGEFLVNTYTTGFQGEPALAFNPDGTFLVSWTSGGSTGSDSNFGIHAQRYAAVQFADDFESGDTSAWSVTVP